MENRENLDNGFKSLKRLVDISSNRNTLFELYSNTAKLEWRCQEIGYSELMYKCQDLRVCIQALIVNF